MKRKKKTIQLFHLIQKRYPDKNKNKLFAQILCGEVLVNGESVKDAKVKVPTDSVIDIQKPGFVSRGGQKLEAAIKQWDLPIKDKVFMDVGASTGGFTDCLLQYGAKGVHAVDVGYNQLAYSLRRNGNVFVHEKCNIFTINNLEPPAHNAVADLSFRTSVEVAAYIFSIISGNWIVILVKPQFELKGYHKEFNGVVKDKEMYNRILIDVIDSYKNYGIGIIDVIPSPISGRKGNKELLFLLSRNGIINRKEIMEKVKEAF